MTSCTLNLTASFPLLRRLGNHHLFFHFTLEWIVQPMQRHTKSTSVTSSQAASSLSALLHPQALLLFSAEKSFHLHRS
jgi:hypothetical protein